MKNITVLLLLFALPVTSFSQSSVKVKEVTLAMSKGTNNGFEVEIPLSNAKEVARDWKRRLTAGSKAKLTETNGEIAMHGWEDKEITQNLFNLYSRCYRRIQVCARLWRSRILFGRKERASKGPRKTG